MGFYNPVEMALVAPSQEVKDAIIMIDHFFSALAKDWTINTQPGQELVFRELDTAIGQYNDEEHTVNVIKAFKEYLSAQWRDDE